MGIIDTVYQSELRAKAMWDIVPEGDIFVGMIGLQMEPKDYSIHDYIGIRRVTNPPGLVHVCCAADKESDAYGVARHSSAIQAEMVIGLGTKKQGKTALLELAYHTAALIKLVGHANLICPVAATNSWDTIAAVKDRSVHFFLLDDAPQYLLIGESLRVLSQEDIELLNAYWEPALLLRQKNFSRRFGLAFNMAYTWNHTSDIRVGLANLWFGIEALFGCQRDRRVTQGLVERIVNWVPIFSRKTVRALYKERCNAVHGRMLTNLSQKAVADSAELLREAIIVCIESSSAPLRDW